MVSRPSGPPAIPASRRRLNPAQRRDRHGTLGSWLRRHPSLWEEPRNVEVKRGRNQWARQDSNLRPFDYESSALTT
jgi:hypothetical protein